MILFTIFKYFYPNKHGEKKLSHEMRNVLERIFVFLIFFFVRFLIFELWSILYFTLVVHFAPHTPHQGLRPQARMLLDLIPNHTS